MQQSFTKRYLLLGLILLLQLCFLCYFGMQKAGFNIDDILSYELSNGYYLPFLELSPDFYNEWHSTDYFMNSLVTSTGTQFQYGSVYYNQTLDVHPPLYYAVFHTVSSLVPGVFSKWIGLCVNLLFFFCTGFLLYQLSALFLKHPLLRYLPTILWGFSIGAVSTFLLIRMYMMLCFWVVLHLYLHLRYISAQKITLWRCCLILFTTSAGFLTHYYFLIFAFFLTLSECTFRLLRKDFVQMIFYGATTLCAVILSFVVYPAAYIHIFAGYRGQESISSALSVSSYLAHIQQALSATSLTACIGFLAAGILCISLLLCLAQKFQQFFASALAQISPLPAEIALPRIFVASASTSATFLVISILAAYSGARYLYFLYPLCALLTCVLLALLFAAMPRTRAMPYLVAALAVCTLAVGWYDNTPTYLESESGNAIANATEYSDASCIFINSSIWQFVGHYIEFATYEQVIFLKPETLDTLPETLSANSGETVLVYLPRSADAAEFLAVLNEALGYSDYELLWSYSYSSVYQLTS